MKILFTLTALMFLVLQNACAFENAGEVEMATLDILFKKNNLEIIEKLKADFRKSGEIKYLHSAMYWLEKEVSNNNSDAMNSLAMIYIENSKKRSDKTKAIQLFSKSCKLENSLACYNLGLRYDQGDGVESNKKKAFNLYLKASNLGFHEATRAVGDMFYQGIGVPKNILKAFDFFQKAADDGNMRAAYNAALMILNGEVVKSKNIAVKLLKNAMNNGNEKAGFALARYYEKNNQYQKAVVSMSHSANLGNLDAINALAIYYLKGLTGSKDKEKALILLEYGKSLGSSMANRNLKKLLKKK